MSEESGEAQDRSAAQNRPQDPVVVRRRPDPGQPAIQYRTLQGFWGESDRPGFRRLYFTRSLSSYAEFRVEDVVATTDIAPEESPYPGEQATRVALPRHAQVDFTRSRPAAIDPFDLDIRFGRRIFAANALFTASEDPLNCPKPGTVGLESCNDTCFGCITPTLAPSVEVVCLTDNTCNTCPPDQTCETCVTCATCPPDATCEIC